MDTNIIKPRLKNIRDKMTIKNIDAILVCKKENYLYLSGFTGTYAKLIITKTKAYLITDSRYIEQAKYEASLYDILDFKGDHVKVINDIISAEAVNSLGFENKFITYDEYKKYKSKLVINKFASINNMIESLRMIKDSYEIDIIKKSVKIADDAFSHILKYIKPGVKEIDLASEIEYFIRRQGAKGVSFDTIVASGQRSSMPHGVASTKEIQNNDAIIIDFGAIYNNYCSDMTRTVFLGTPKNELKMIYQYVLEAQLFAIQNIQINNTVYYPKKYQKPNMKWKDIDKTARLIIEGYSFGENFGHSLGHGVGLEIHEGPRVSGTEDEYIQNGMIVTIEPGIYVEGLGGVRIEDMILVSDSKAKILTSSSKEMIIL